MFSDGFPAGAVTVRETATFCGEFDAPVVVTVMVPL
jgi:hypothetical protein